MRIQRLNSTYGFLLLLVIWGALDLVCAMLCEIHADEAYYRLYGQYLDWGYFDHPPIVGLLAHISDMLVAGSGVIGKRLGVRLMTVLLHMATMVVLWKSLRAEGQVKCVVPFFVLCGSMVMFSAYGFITAPDAPLLFFAALFFYSYRKYIELPSWRYALLIGVSMAGMVYSKYMAILVIGLLVMSNWRLVKDGRLWAAAVLAGLLLLPHIYWQYSHHFPSISYHIVERASSVRWVYMLEYLPNQLLVFNPLAYVLMWFLSIRYAKSADPFRRCMAWEIIGFQVFFALMTLRGHVEPHWTMVSTIAVIILLYEEWVKDEGVLLKHRAWLGKAMAGMCILVIAARAVLCMNILPERTGLAHKESYYAALHEQAQGLPIVFDGSFQRASLYRYYYNDEAVVVRQATDRYTQYDLLHLERAYIGKKVYWMRGGQAMVKILTKEDLQ